ncbi:MAG: hypothetical protein ACLFUG_05740 [Nitriliruptoraceae bacterium]
MNLGKLRRRLQVTDRGAPATVVRTRGDDTLAATERRAAPRPVADHELPPLVVVERPDEPGARDQS